MSSNLSDVYSIWHSHDGVTVRRSLLLRGLGNSLNMVEFHLDILRVSVSVCGSVTVRVSASVRVRATFPTHSAADEGIKGTNGHFRLRNPCNHKRHHLPRRNEESKGHCLWR